MLIGGRLSSSGAGTPKDSCDPLYACSVRPPLRRYPFKRSKTHPPVRPSRSPCLNAGLTMSSPFEFGRIPRLERDFSASRYGLLCDQYIETMHVANEREVNVHFSFPCHPRGYYRLFYRRFEPQKGHDDLSFERRDEPGKYRQCRRVLPLTFLNNGSLGEVEEGRCPFGSEVVPKRLPENRKTRRGSRIQPVQRSLRLGLKKFHECMLIGISRVPICRARGLWHHGGFVRLVGEI